MAEKRKTVGVSPTAVPKFCPYCGGAAIKFVGLTPRCRVVGCRMAFNGEGKGPNQGKIVTTVLLVGQAGVEQENVWRCKSDDVLQTYYGVGTEADFLECWLEVVDIPGLQNTTTQDVALSA